jgi:hypothetical protein
MLGWELCDSCAAGWLWNQFVCIVNGEAGEGTLARIVTQSLDFSRNLQSYIKFFVLSVLLLGVTFDCQLLLIDRIISWMNIQ